MAKERMSVNISYALTGDNGTGVYDNPTVVHASYQICENIAGAPVYRPKSLEVTVTPGTDTMDAVRTAVVADINTAEGIV